MAPNSNISIVPRVLIAEDDPFLSLAIASALTSEGLKTKRVIRGDQVILCLQKEPYSLLILDLVLPNKNGFEVLREIKRLKIKIPILVFSNLSQKGNRSEALALGAKEYYVKSSLSIDDMIKKVKRHL
jgi:DNA-binding response OmpR family regulator